MEGKSSFWKINSREETSRNYFTRTVIWVQKLVKTMKCEKKQLIHAQFIKKINKMASFASCYPVITSFQKHESHFFKDWGSFFELWRIRKKFSCLLFHRNQASALGSDKTWVLLNVEIWSTKSFSRGKSNTGWWVTFRSKDVDAGTIILRPLEVYFLEKTLSVTDSD